MIRLYSLFAEMTGEGPATGGGSPPLDDTTPSSVAPAPADEPDDAGTPVPTIDELAAAHGGNLDGFDPAIHAVDANGAPIRTVRGTFAKKRGRRPMEVSARADSVSVAAHAPGISTAPSTSPNAVGIAPAVNPAKLEAAAGMSANMVFNVSVGVFGEEWVPSKEEARMVKDAFRDYYQANGFADLPPGVALVVALGVYSLPRLRHENTRTKLKKIGAWCKSAFSYLRRN